MSHRYCVPEIRDIRAAAVSVKVLRCEGSVRLEICTEVKKVTE